MKASMPIESNALTGHQKHEFSWVLHWVGVALLASFVVDLVSQAWPVALLQPAWLDRMNAFFASRSITPLIGVLLVAGAGALDPHSKPLTTRANLFRRLACLVAIGYLLLIPLQIYSGVKLLRAQQQQATQLLAQASKAIEAIRMSTTEAELRNAYEQIPGQKQPLPEELPMSLNLLRERLVEAVESRSKRAEYDFQQRMSSLWQKSIGLIFANIARLLIFSMGFAAIGRFSANQPSFLLSIQKRNRGMRDWQAKSASRKLETDFPEEWIVNEKK